MIGVVVAETEALARRAAKLVVVEYGEDLPVIMSCEEAIEAGQYFKEYEVCQTVRGSHSSSITSTFARFTNNVKPFNHKYTGSKIAMCQYK